jgi:hypothetical protein
MLNILNVADNRTTWPDYCNRILFDYILILLETSVMWELHSLVCRCPIDLVFEGNIPLYNGVLSFRLNEYLGFEVLH